MSKPWLARYIVPLFLLIGTACTSLPAQTPPQLQQTPGAYIVVNESTVQTPLYWVDVPAGWKIVKNSIAADPIALVFAAPDDSMTISVSELEPADRPADALMERAQEMVTLSNGQRVYVWGEAQKEFVETFNTAFEKVSRSIRLPS